MLRGQQSNQNSKSAGTSLRRRRGEAKGSSWYSKLNSDTMFFLSIVGFVVFVFSIEIAVFNTLEVTDGLQQSSGATSRSMQSKNENSAPVHLVPKVPILPLFNSIPSSEDYVARLMEGRPTMAGITALLQKFLDEFHKQNEEKLKNNLSGETSLSNFFGLVGKYLEPFDAVYRGRSIFPIREDESIFMSVAAFREGLLTATLVSAFKNAKNPEKLFVGLVVQNCFGKVLEDGTIDTSGKPCTSGPIVVDKNNVNKKGVPIRKKVPIEVDRNGVEDFCALPNYEKYCKNGQIRVVYLHHTDSLGPSMARYYASKLWGGENFFVQIDSHLRFASEWDAKYIKEIKLTKSYPKSVMSSYPPGFEQVKFIPKRMNIDLSKVNNETVIESPGCRLCQCKTPLKEQVPIIHIHQGKSYFGDEDRPKQTAYIGAGFIFSHSALLKDVPFDPYLPWTFMGEEILFTMRAWTNGWNIYAPRKNLIIHQYRPASLGIPKFHGAINAG